jgi:hypothetical protein
MLRADDEFLRTLTAAQESRLTDSQKAVRKYLRHRARVEHAIGIASAFVTLAALAYQSFALH